MTSEDRARALESKGGKNASGSCCDHSSHPSAGKAEVAVAVRTVKKVMLSYRLAVFAGAVISLSWFFEGTRQINEALTLEHAALLLLGSVATALFIGIYSYWIYVEEKSKGNLKKQIKLFDRLEVPD